jgi:hypothetical protein
MVPCYTCLDQSSPIDTAGPAQNNTPNRRSTAHRLNSITKHQHTNIPSKHTRSKQKIQLEQYTNSRKIFRKAYKSILHVTTITQT